MIEQAFRLAKQRQTYLNLLYLLVSFPLGLIYFILLIVGITVGLSTLAVWIGIPVLLLTMGAWWSIAVFERSHAISWLHIQIPPMKLPDTSHSSLWQQVRAYLYNPVTWKSLAYLIVKFLFGILALIIIVSALPLMLAISLVSLSLGLTLIPLFYLLYLLIGPPLKLGSFNILLIALLWLIPIICSIVFGILMLVYPNDSGSQEAKTAFIVLFCCSLLGVVGLGWFFFASRSRTLALKHIIEPRSGGSRLRQWFLLSLSAYGIVLLPLYLFNGLAGLWGQFASSMLGMSSSALRIVEAERIANLERAKAERAERSRRELMVNVSHELKTPVASIRGHIESLLLGTEDKERSSSPEETQRYLEIVYREAIRLGELVDDLLSLASNDANELSVDLAAVNAAEVVEEVYQTLMPLARRQRQIILIRKIEAGLQSVQADRRRLMQVLLNLVRNAITYTPDGGIVSIQLSAAVTGWVELSVADTGIGIAENDLEKIFERFYRTDASRSRSSGGFGLGLAIVRDFVQAMGGTISVESKENEGTIFRVQLCPYNSCNLIKII
jgi:signal transduction histidine kinase